tara:strand:- start:2283 stop:3032 length:750 start_codon:yes stop_codon:yes gene_type:complete
MADYQKVEIKAEEAPPMAPDQAEPMQEAIPEAPQEPVIERPEWLPEKFETPEAMAYAYKQLEQEYSKSRAGEETPEEAPAGVDPETFAALSEEFDETGDVSEESRSRLAETGIPREFIDEYIEGQKIMAETAIKDVYQSVGGEDNYNNMLNWATNNLSDQEIDVFNDLVAGSPQEVQMAVAGLYARYSQQAPTQPTQPLMQGEPSSDLASGSTFQSRAQITEAMSDPRYKKDPAYRNEVYRRLQNSKAL